MKTVRSFQIKLDIFREDLQADCEFEAKYVELHPLGEGGCGSVFAGYRKSDHLDVAIKHVPNKYQYCKHVDEEGREISGEVAVMLKLRSGTSHSAGSRAPIALLDWYVLPHELILVLERPMPAVDLQTYVEECRDTFGEKEAKMILKQLVKAAISLQDKKIFHRDIKVENILIDMSSGAPQVRLIDFGVSCFTESHSEYTTFYGTEIHAPPEWWYEHTYSARPTTVWQLGIVLFECLHNKNFSSTKLMEKKLQLRRRPSLEQILLHPCHSTSIHSSPLHAPHSHHPSSCSPSINFLFGFSLDIFGRSCCRLGSQT
uniref:non-specific serine/threonine protein kinase n=1 Tax=Oryzias latipes TaxID=8090 RepID=A0A3B3HGI4_ORYLA